MSLPKNNPFREDPTPDLTKCIKQIMEGSANPVIITEALAPTSAEANKVIGHFIEKGTGNRFEYRNIQSDWGKKHGYPHEVWVGSGKTRSANVKGTVCYIVTDEDDEGKPVVEKWMIKSHFKYVKAD
jgi:hypothetical protein